MRVIDSPSPNFNERLHPLDMLVLHYTGMKDGPAALERMCDPKSEVSAHYMVEEDGRIFRLVAEEKRAWQAGRSQWRGDDDLNSRSIGIEIVNGGHEYGLPPFPDEQIAAVIALCQGILSRWPIPQNRVVAHSDIAPDRKNDPGERFPWKRLAEAGIGVWPGDAPVEQWMWAGLSPASPEPVVEQVQRRLGEIGYKIAATGAWNEATAAVIRAFQRRWRPVLVSGEADAETLALIEAVAELTR